MLSLSNNHGGNLAHGTLDQATALLPPGEVNSILPPREGSNSSQAIAHLPTMEGGTSPQVGQSSNQFR